MRLRRRWRWRWHWMDDDDDKEREMEENDDDNRKIERRTDDHNNDDKRGVPQITDGNGGTSAYINNYFKFILKLQYSFLIVVLLSLSISLSLLPLSHLFSLSHRRHRPIQKLLIVESLLVVVVVSLSLSRRHCHRRRHHRPIQKLLIFKLLLVIVAPSKKNWLLSCCLSSSFLHPKIVDCWVAARRRRNCPISSLSRSPSLAVVVIVIASSKSCWLLSCWLLLDCWVAAQPTWRYDTWSMKQQYREIGNNLVNCDHNMWWSVLLTVAFFVWVSVWVWFE